MARIMPLRSLCMQLQSLRPDILRSGVPSNLHLRCRNLHRRYVLYPLVLAKGMAWVVCVYGIPLLIVNAFLVLITYLQCTHPTLPHYDSSEWDWLRGALATIDHTLPHRHACRAPSLLDHAALLCHGCHQKHWREMD